MFSGTDLAEAIGVPLYYGFMSSALLSLYCVICWKAGWTKAPKDESFCVIVSTNYELEEAICRDEGESHGDKNTRHILTQLATLTQASR